MSDNFKGEVSTHETSDFAPRRGKVNIVCGEMAQVGKIVYRIDQVLDFQSVVATDLESGRSAHLRIADLRPVEDAEPVQQTDLATIAEDDWRIAQERYATIYPLIGPQAAGRPHVEARAKAAGKSAATLYRWLKRYNVNHQVADLAPRKTGWKEGRSRLSVAADDIINDVIDDTYLTKRRVSIDHVHLEIKSRCRHLRIEAPGLVAVRRRVARIDEKTRLKRRGFKDLARNRFDPSPGHMPNADYPLQLVQIDHTTADIEIVDDELRLPIGRPFLTLAIDVSTRMITGYYLSLDPPSAAAVGLCIAHSVLPKEDWLLLHGVEGDWPVWGFPRTIHVDNGKDFRSTTVERACLQDGIHLEFRPLDHTEFGGHVERALGTYMRQTHNLPGTTFSSVKEKGEHDPAAAAVMTLSEFEAWFVEFLVNFYHRRKHKRIYMPPIRKWEIGFLGNAEQPGMTLPPRPDDRQEVLLNFTPMFDRTVQPIGVSISDLTYYDEALRPWIGSRDKNTGKARKFVFRRDPRDISAIHFFDPTLKQYFRIPTANIAFPSMSLSSYRAAQEAVKQEGRDHTDEHAIIRSFEKQRDQIKASTARTRKARRENQRRKEHEKKVSPDTPLRQVRPVLTGPTSVPDDSLSDGPVGTFEQIQ